MAQLIPSTRTTRARVRTATWSVQNVAFLVSIAVLSSLHCDQRHVVQEVESFSPTAPTTRYGQVGGLGMAGRVHYQQQSKCYSRRSTTKLCVGSFSSFEDDDDDEVDDDEYIDMESLGDWRTFRRALAMGGDNGDGSMKSPSDDGLIGSDSVSTTTTTTSKSSAQNNKKKSSSSSVRKRPTSVSKDNEDVLRSQNEELAMEYMTGVWAHETSTPETGGLVIRMPLEVELYRNHRHSLLGRKLKRILDGLRDDNSDSDGNDDDESSSPSLEISTWYARAKKMIEDEMVKIAAMADGDGQIDATQLKEEASEMLSLYLDNQERWQEVCLVIEHAGSNEEEGAIKAKSGESITLVLNRPMAFQLTESLGRLVLLGAYVGESNNKYDVLERKKNLKRFMMAFQNECGVYVGGPDEQGNPATMIHGISDLPGAVEISPGTKIYKGGIPAAIDGVLEGKYSPLEFRFFLGCHKYEESALDVSVHLGKFQPVACARSVALKQCISLPKPLWHEVMELCGGELADLSSLELLKRDDLQFQVVDESEYDEDDDDEAIEIEIEIDDDDDDNYLQ